MVQLAGVFTVDLIFLNEIPKISIHPLLEKTLTRKKINQLIFELYWLKPFEILAKNVILFLSTLLLFILNLKAVYFLFIIFLN